jgi:hypothetical protein
MYATWNPEKGEPAIIRLSDIAFISMSDENRDYRKYLAWVADGNTAEEWQPNAVEPETTQPDMEEEV